MRSSATSASVSTCDLPHRRLIYDYDCTRVPSSSASGAGRVDFRSLSNLGSWLSSSTASAVAVSYGRYANVSETDMEPARTGRDMCSDFHIEDPSLAERFEEVLDDLVARCPVARSNEGTGYYAINRYTDVRRCAQDWQTFSST